MLKSCFLFVLVLLSPLSYCGDLGSYGNTYPIIEKDGEQLLKSTLTKNLANGGQAKLTNDARQRFVDEMSNIPPSKGVVLAKETRVRMVDLSQLVPKNITDEKGAVIVSAGAIINPLKNLPLTKKIFFIDARVQSQLDFVRGRALPRDKIILTAGNLWMAQDYLKRSVSLDMGLSQKMRVQATPSICSQGDNAKLKIEEYAL